jgi:trk system potassium uptake protein TrkH
MFSFNFFFTQSLYTFNVDDTTYIFTFMVMLFAAVFTSALTSKLIRSKELAKIGEMKFLFALLCISIPEVAFAGLYGVYSSMGESFRIAAFQVVSALSITGFSTVTYTSWNPSMLLIMIILMLIGGGAGSTAGGIKFSRVYVLYKSLVAAIRAKLLPERAVNEQAIFKPQGKVYLTPVYLVEVCRFTFAHMIIYFLGVLLLIFGGVPMGQAMFEFGSSLGTVGLSIGVTGAGTNSYGLQQEKKLFNRGKGSLCTEKAG